jgi:hypothetical protein
MMGLNRHKRNSRGFTIVELTIATGVFSIILLLAMAGFIQIGKLFYKGVNITGTSDVGKHALNSIKSDVSFDTLTTSYAFQNAPVSTPSGSVERKYFCAGTNRYTFILHKQLDADAEAAEMQTSVAGWYKFALLKDRIVNGCPNPFVTTGPSPDPIDPNEATELLGDKMRLSYINIQPVAGTNNKLYTIIIKVAYGDNEVLQYPTSDPDNPECKPTSTLGASFCYVSDLRTIVRKGL